jgi:hypothetical protein
MYGMDTSVFPNGFSGAKSRAFHVEQTANWLWTMRLQP